MKKLMISTAGGLGLAILCGLAGLPHLSASIVTLTVFCTVHALAAVASVWLAAIWYTLPNRIAAWAEPSSSVSVGGKRESGA
ncbi:hypothetical protein FHX10_003014 [Rhizobium sp. BK591]|uniref:hypothetical protein n=1 Tax=Rhizobium sp. BK591 TaxID=2586985 RepID=UPI00161E325A|nr:hypothetical protein [Rhizobium sp. BK591]MBB3743515.1 hypothetical protein [Rhizobium sp. BK591]